MTSSAPPIPAVDPTRPGTSPWRPGVALAALVGVIAVGLAVGIAELLAAFGGWIGVFGAHASPLTSLGQSFIQVTPEWLKEFAICTRYLDESLWRYRYLRHESTMLTTDPDQIKYLAAAYDQAAAKLKPNLPPPPTSP